MRRSPTLRKLPSACALALALSVPASAAHVTWSDKSSALWIRDGQHIDLRAERTADALADLRVEGRDLVGESCVIAPVRGTADDFASVAAPDDGYLDRLAIEGMQLAVARCGSTYAKLLIEARQYDPAGGRQNARGFMLTFALSTEVQ